jgi:hypothetical protein
MEMAKRVVVAAATVLALGVFGVLAASAGAAATVINTIPVGSGPEGVSSDGTHVWSRTGH